MLVPNLCGVVVIVLREVLGDSTIDTIADAKVVVSMPGRQFSVIVDTFSLLSIVRTLIPSFSLSVSSVSCGKSSSLIIINNVV